MGRAVEPGSHRFAAQVCVCVSHTPSPTFDNAARKLPANWTLRRAGSMRSL